MGRSDISVLNSRPVEWRKSLGIILHNTGTLEPKNRLCGNNMCVQLCIKFIFRYNVHKYIHAFIKCIVTISKNELSAYCNRLAVVHPPMLRSTAMDTVRIYTGHIGATLTGTGSMYLETSLTSATSL